MLRKKGIQGYADVRRNIFTPPTVMAKARYQPADCRRSAGADDDVELVDWYSSKVSLVWPGDLNLHATSASTRVGDATHQRRAMFPC